MDRNIFSFTEAKILQPPQPQTATVGMNATFECIGIGEIIWVLNGSLQLSQESVREALIPFGIFVEYPEAQTISRLIVAATVANNQTLHIQCVAQINAFNNVESTSVTLTVLGKSLS